VKRKLTPHALDQLFRSARTYRSWTSDALSEDKTREIYDLMK
jgi:hypothetical protein